MLELIIERGMQLLQTTEGEKLPRVVETVVRQLAAAPGECTFTMFVNQPGLCRYDGRRITTPGGNTLRQVQVLKSKPAVSELEPEKLMCRCSIAFHYNTGHRAHFATLSTAN